MITPLLIAALAVLPTDRLAMADRLFNKGEYAAARGEYAALKGEKSIAEDDLLFRLAESDRKLGANETARKGYTELLQKCPLSRYADRARLNRALSGSDEDRLRELPQLTADGTEVKVRAAALYYLGCLKRDPAMLQRAAKADPAGSYASYATFSRAAIMAESADAKTRREAVAELLTVAFDAKSAFAQQALYLAARQSYRDGKHDEAFSLFNRYLARYPKASDLNEVRRLAAWSAYLAARYADSQKLCGEGGTDDFDFLRPRCAEATGDKDGARRLLKTYLDKYPSGGYRKDAELSLAHLDFDAAAAKGDTAGILENARRAAQLSGTGADRLRLAWAYEKSGDDAKSMAEYAAIAKAFPGSADAAEALYRSAMIDLRAKAYSAAELKLAEALASGKLSGERTALAGYWRGIAAISLDHRAEGAKFLAEALKGSLLPLDETREARLLLADEDFRLGRKAEAKEAYRKLLEEGAAERMGATKLHELGRLFYVDGRYDPAEICADQLTKSESAEWRQLGYVLKGEILTKRETYSAAIEAFRRAYAKGQKIGSSEAAQALVTLGTLESRAGEHDTAEATLKRAVEANPTDNRARAMAYLALARNAKAKGDAEASRGYATVVTALFDDEQLTAEAKELLK